METKTCNFCNEKKAVEEFPFRNKAKGIRNTRCKSCYKEYRKGHYPDYYEKKKHEYRARRVRWKEQRQSEIHGNVIEYLKTHPCIVCSESDIVVLDFDHRDPKEKDNNVSTMIQQLLPWDLIKEEIDKCDVLCANCHRRRTAKQFGWYRLEN
ncbi:hypothetical protein MARVELLAND_22 [Bacillus phage vB_BspM_MarvelLand]|nr:hypothetical protein MARVELLAND_22 [Bacillus phage vB_BspM_MarvelLand]